MSGSSCIPMNYSVKNTKNTNTAITAKPQILVCSSIDRERVTEHRIPALGLLLRGLVLDYVPMLDQNSVLGS
jgi:hypothetical protein